MWKIFPLMMLFSLIFYDFFFYELILFISVIELISLSMSLTKNWYHIIMMIVLLEIMSVVLFKIVSVSGLILMSNNIIFFFITLMVVEACIGMVLVVVNSRSGKEEVANY